MTLATYEPQEHNSDVCRYCLYVHAMPVAGENWELDQDPTGEIYDSLSLYVEESRVYWDTVTVGSSFVSFERMIENVAADYLRNGDVICECKD